VNVYGQVKSWIDDGLRARAVTRDLDWGIPVPVEGADGKVLYVWFDAPIGYISSTKEWAAREGKNWEDYWKAKDTKLVHFIGKDNIVFHCVIFPIMLKAEGSYILPENVPANEFLNLEDFPGQQDVLRYALTANAPETKDNDFTWKDFQARNNNELVAIFGNFINRVVVLTDKYYEGEVPAPGQYSDVDEQTLITLRAYPSVIASSIEKYRFREAQGELMNLARSGNKYLADEEPWKMIKTDEERVKTVMYVALQIAAALATLSEPFLPFTSAKLKKILNMEQENTPGTEGTKWKEISTKETLLPEGHRIGKAELLFSKIEDDQIQEQLNKLEATKAANAAENKKIEPQKEMATFEDFSKMDLRVGTIVEATKMPKADKLLVLKINTGLDTRTIVSGIAESFKPEDIIGKKVTVLVNLAPRKLRGVESQGMILMTEDAEGKLVFLNPDRDGVENGVAIS
jgi:methionyl-tRNA synthetase